MRAELDAMVHDGNTHTTLRQEKGGADKRQRVVATASKLGHAVARPAFGRPRSPCPRPRPHQHQHTGSHPGKVCYVQVNFPCHRRDVRCWAIGHFIPKSSSGLAILCTYHFWPCTCGECGGQGPGFVLSPSAPHFPPRYG